MILALLAGASLAASPTCSIPVIIDELTIPEDLEPKFIESLHDAMSVWNQSGAGVRLSLAGEARIPWNSGAITIRWSGDKDGMPEAMAYTYARYAGVNITEAKMEFMLGEEWCPGDDRRNCYDMKNAMIHEMGHALGLVHSKVDGSVMMPGMRMGELPQWTLHDTDIKNITSLYPQDGSGCWVGRDRVLWNIRGVSPGME